MDEQALRRSIEAIDYYRKEIENWSAVPLPLIMSRERLAVFVQFEIPFLVDKEIAMLRCRINELKYRRLGRLIQ
jgi:hypothetical protein